LKITDNRRAIILTETGSPYFEQGIFILRENVVKEEDKLLNEARSVAERYAKKCEISRNFVKTGKNNALKNGGFLLLGGVFGAAAVLITVFL